MGSITQTVPPMDCHITQGNFLARKAHLQANTTSHMPQQGHMVEDGSVMPLCAHQETIYNHLAPLWCGLQCNGVEEVGCMGFGPCTTQWLVLANSNICRLR